MHPAFATLCRALLGVVLGLAIVSAGHTATLAGWDVSTLTGGSNNFGPSPLPPTLADANLTVGGLARGPGVGTTGTGAARAWGGNDWQSTTVANAVAGGDYASFSVSAKPGYQVSFSSIARFDYRRSTTGPASGVLQYQIGAGPFFDIATLNYASTSSAGASLGPIDLSSIAALQNVPAGTTVTFRIVNYGGTSATGTWYLFDTAASAAPDLELQGSVSSAGPINGACGGANGLVLTTAPSANLCSAGTSTTVTGSGHPWSWSCLGSGGGTDATCSATIQTYALTFLTDGNGSLSGNSSQIVDHGANAEPVTALPNAGYAFLEWTGNNGFATTQANPLTVTNVTAAQTITARFTAAPINGACGPADGQLRAIAPTTGLCSIGTASAVSGTGPWTWSCSGYNGGATAVCSAALDTTPHFKDYAPLADSQVVEATPTSNSGASTSLYVASASGGSFGNERVWLAFDLSRPLPPGASITGAKLRLYVYKAAAADLPVTVHASSDSGWSESGITWANQPAFDATPLASGTLLAHRDYQWVEFDVTSYLQAQYGNATRVNLLVKAANEGTPNGPAFAFNSREYRTGLAPRLRIEYVGGAWPTNDVVNIIHTNDIHSRLTPHDLDFPDGPGETAAFEDAGGAAYLATKILERKAANLNALVLDAGDISEGGPLGDLRVNGGMVDFLATLDAQLKALPGNASGRGIDAIVIGNHDVRDAQMLANMQSSGLPFIAVNMLNKGAAIPPPAAWPAANPFRPYVIVNTQSSAGTPVKVAVLGYLTDDSAILSPSTESLIDVKETRWSDNDPNTLDLKPWVAHLRNVEQADIVVLLSHIGHRRYNAGDEILLGDGDVAPPDLVVSGHWHTWGKTAWQPANLNYNTAVVEAASYAQYVGEVQLTPAGRYVNAEKHPIKPAAIAPNAAVQSLINALTAEYEALTSKPCVLPPSVTGRASAAQPCPLDHVVGYSAVDLKLDKDKWFTLSEFPWSGDNNAGAWIADATVWKLNQLGIPVQLALQSGGGVRRDVKAGPVTYLDIYETYPWSDDRMVVVTLTSADLWAYLESHYVGSSISQGWQVTADDGEIVALTYNGVPLGKNDTSTTWQVAISEYMFLHDEWISESGTRFDFQSKPNVHYTQSIRDAVVEYTAQFGAANPMTIPGPRYVLNTELAGGFKAVVTMVNDAESEPYFEGVFIRLLEALPETVARRTGYGLAGLVNADGSINRGHEFAETLLYRSHLGFPDGVLRVGDIIEVWGEGGFFAGNPQLVDQESVYAPGKEFKHLGYDPALAAPEFHASTASFFNEAGENRLVKFRAVRTGDKTVRDADGVSITLYREGGFNTVGRLPGQNGAMLELIGVQTQRGNERRFRVREATVVTGGFVPYAAVNPVSPNPATGGPIILTANANDPATGGAFTAALAPVADAQVASGYPSTNYGSSTSLYVQSGTSGFGNERAWLRFDLAGALPISASINAARLKLYQWRPSGTGLAVAAHASSDVSWNEGTLTWAGQPAFEPTALDTQTIANVNTWYTWNVTAHVATQLAASNTALTFVAKPATEDVASATYAFNAREYGTNTPLLEVDYSVPVVNGQVVSVQFFYRHAPDGVSFGPWTAIGSDTAAPWSISFNFPHGPGRYEFYASATDNDGNVQPAPVVAQASVDFVAPQSQTIAFAPLPDRNVADAPFTVSATASSGLTVTFSSLSPAVCGVSGQTVTLLAIGSCAIAADQAGDTSYLPAPQVVQSFFVHGVAQTISFAPLADQALGGGPVPLVASASSGLPVQFTSLTPSVCTVSGAQVTLIAAGSCSIAANQPGDSYYAAAAPVVQGFVVTGGVASAEAEVPLPAWALALLALALLGAAQRRRGRA